MNLSERERKREASFICYYVKSTLLQSFWWQPGCATAKCIPQTLMTILLSSFIPLCPFISRPSRGAIPHDYTLPTIQCVAHVSYDIFGSLSRAWRKSHTPFINSRGLPTLFSVAQGDRSFPKSRKNGWAP